ncbi:hypothetical protein CEXT_709071 [Caerostris extrusa]|uniref:Uncharacterized protein n=1 Tax=Caerostris extrusa TaxID=172846 RepID=A0AAV4VMI9_CAEEX|nr:hypothetical protein CEXT_709071 [Caerostris extrusa]
MLAKGRTLPPTSSARNPPDASFEAYIQQSVPFHYRVPSSSLPRKDNWNWRERKSGDKAEFSNLGKREFPSALNIFGESADLFSNRVLSYDTEVWGSYAN